MDNYNYLIDSAFDILNDLSIPVSDNIKFIFSKDSVNKINAFTFKKDSYWVIEIYIKDKDNNELLREILHECVHTAPNSFKHEREWKNYAYIIYRKTGIRI